MCGGHTQAGTDWKTVEYGEELNEPMVFVTANTNNDCLANVMRVNNQGDTSFEVMTQREEALDDAPGV